MPEYAYMPPAMSAIDRPTFDGVSGVPVIDSRPASLCTAGRTPSSPRTGLSIRSR